MIHWHIWEPRLTEAEIGLLETFLTSLTDEAFMPEIPTEVPSGLPVTGARAPVGTSTTTLMHNGNEANVTTTTGRNDNSGGNAL